MSLRTKKVYTWIQLLIATETFCPERKKCALSIQNTCCKSFRVILQKLDSWEADKIDVANVLLGTGILPGMRNHLFLSLKKNKNK